MNKTFILISKILEQATYIDPLLSLKKIDFVIDPELKSAIEKGNEYLSKSYGVTKTRNDKQANDSGPYIEIDKKTKEKILVLPTDMDVFSDSLGLKGVSSPTKKMSLPIGSIFS